MIDWLSFWFGGCVGIGLYVVAGWIGAKLGGWAAERANAADRKHYR